jgi:hypothetical protein
MGDFMGDFYLYEGIRFRQELEACGKESKLVLEIVEALPTSSHYETVRDYGCFYNKFQVGNCGFLWLAEGIYTASDLEEAKERLKVFLETNRREIWKCIL